MKLKLAALLAVSTVVGAIPTTPVEAQSGTITIRVCNRSYDDANVAVSYKPVGSGSFYNEGWFTVYAGRCRDIATTSNSYFYTYAEVLNDGTRYWSGDHSLCLEYPGPYAFWTSGTYCASYQTTAYFVEHYARSYGVYTWNLDP